MLDPVWQEEVRPSPGGGLSNSRLRTAAPLNAHCVELKDYSRVGGCGQSSCSTVFFAWTRSTRELRFPVPIRNDMRQLSVSVARMFSPAACARFLAPFASFFGRDAIPELF